MKREIEALKNMKESDIDTSDIPVLPPEKWATAQVGRFYKPLKTPVSLRLDSDVLQWLKSQDGEYQTRINALLREQMMKAIR